MNKTGAAALALAISLLSLPCQRKNGIKGLDLTVAFSPRSLTDDLYVDVTSVWRLSKNFQGFREKQPLLIIFRHGEDVLAEDSFFPDVPTSEWASGDEYEFIRRIYIPPFIDEYDPDFRGAKPVLLTVGLGANSRSDGETETVLLRKRLRVLPASLTPAVLYMDGWGEPRRSPEDGSPLGRWTGQRARCLIDNPRRNALLVIRGEADLETVPDQEITVRVGGTVLEKFRPAEREFERSFPVSRGILGDDKDFFLEISVDRTFLPAEVGTEGGKERGVYISFIYFK